MWKREELIALLNQVREIDSKYEIFGADEHRYRLNPPIQASFVRTVEERYGFLLPEDYFRFITEVGDGGAGPAYGIEPFTKFLEKGIDAHDERFLGEYRNSLANPFVPRKMRPDEVGKYSITSREAYDKDPDRYFIYKKPQPYDLCDTDGFYVLGTHGCQWDFGLIISGEHRGQVFDTDDEGAYALVAYSFEEFYQDWLDHVLDTEKLRADLEKWRQIMRKP